MTERFGNTLGIIRGTVTEVSSEYIYVEYEVDGFIGTGQCMFPYVGHQKYDPMQWKREGYLKRKKIPLCSCGGDFCNTTHSTWCEKYDKFK